MKDFPATLKTKKEVVDMVTHLIWLMSVKHAAVDYPVGEYGAFTPLFPTKLYNDSRVPPDMFAVFNLAHVNISVVSRSLSEYDKVGFFEIKRQRTFAAVSSGMLVIHSIHILTYNLK